jgi:hypothetical protein
MVYLHTINSIFGRPWNETFWYILCITIWYWYVNLVFVMAIWYTFPVVVCSTKQILATHSRNCKVKFIVLMTHFKLLMCIDFCIFVILYTYVE